ncbi:gliding motility-associated C-terminal domain-containing protein [Mucilaginibacter agri]|uniref:T9SS type B sorting domain-containing protein n=1 Tax=Mucilaginibacter agri TaxID=2695265 RepID=A0A966DTD3_9SPHI|nr:gliding motility-associated C-terminal domain-containing protein [Mucilaginibacter agri]NCD69296.1 T9SS type B sorting domain-containing protein [Mucilaginibacter agri]
MRQLFSFLLLICFFAGSLTALAQGSLGKPAVSETFGAGPNPGGPLPAGVTTLIYQTGACPDDEYYTIVNSSNSNCFGAWFNIPSDHTGDPNGYFMLVNASRTPSVFYTQVVKNSELCPNTTYLFNAYIMNVIRGAGSSSIQPNITFRIETSTGTLLAESESGNIRTEDTPTWRPYGMTFVSPSNGADVVIKMINNAPGGIGNDLALDDITFSPYGPVIETGFNSTTSNAAQDHCEGDPLIYTLESDQTGYSNPSYQWQSKRPGDVDWTNVPGGNSKNLPVNIPKSVAGVYQYRIGILDGANTSPNCVIYSDPLVINVHAYPANTLAATTGTCAGSPLLNATGGDTYDWTAPNGAVFTGPNPTITNMATAGDNGRYRLKITTNGCPTFATTQVTVYQTASVDPIAPPSPICEGSSVQLTAVGHNATHYKWTPSTGLDHDNIPNPIASPNVTTDYQVTVSNDGCSAPVPPALVQVRVLKKPQADAGQTIKMFEGQTVRLKGIVKGDDVTSYWSPPDFLDNPLSPVPRASPTSDITYTLHVVSDRGCTEATSSVFVRVYKKLGIPNTFTPNGDGKNDQWNITNLQTYPNAAVSIYNRSGQQVFQSNGYGIPWDGTYNGSSLPVGTYYYLIDLREDNLPKQSGWLFIAR